MFHVRCSTCSNKQRWNRLKETIGIKLCKLLWRYWYMLHGRGYIFRGIHALRRFYHLFFVFSCWCFCCFKQNEKLWNIFTKNCWSLSKFFNEYLNSKCDGCEKGCAAKNCMWNRFAHQIRMNENVCGRQSLMIDEQVTVKKPKQSQLNQKLNVCANRLTCWINNADVDLIRSSNLSSEMNHFQTAQPASQPHWNLVNFVAFLARARNCPFHHIFIISSSSVALSKRFFFKQKICISHDEYVRRTCRLKWTKHRHLIFSFCCGIEQQKFCHSSIKKKSSNVKRAKKKQNL